MYPFSVPISIYSGTSSYNDVNHENVNAKGLMIFLNSGTTGAGTVTSTLKYRDGYGNDYSMGSFSVTGTTQEAIFTVYPGLLGTSATSPVIYQTLNGVLPRHWHVDSINTNNLSYQLSVNEIP